MKKKQSNNFQMEANSKNENLFFEVIGMLKNNKKYWLVPIILVLIIFGMLILLGSSTMAPFIYTLF